MSGGIYQSPYKTPKPEIEPSQAFVLVVTTTTERLFETRTALLEYSKTNGLPIIADHSHDIYAALMFGELPQGVEAGTMNICDLIAHCIQSGSLDADIASSVSSSSSSLSETTTINNNDITSIVMPTGEQLNDPAQCTDDQLFGAATYLTDYMHTTILDLMEQVELAASKIDAQAIIASFVPMLGQSVELIAWAYELGAELYKAGYTNAIRDEIRCDLFCMMKDGCTLTEDDLIDYFAAKSAIDIFSRDVEYIISQVVLFASGQSAVYGFHALLASIMNTGGKFGSLTGVRSLQTAMKLGSNDTDPDHAILCGCSNPNCNLYDFKTAQGAWTAYASRAQYQNPSYLTPNEGAWVRGSSSVSSTLMQFQSSAVSGTYSSIRIVGGIAAGNGDYTLSVRANGVSGTEVLNASYTGGDVTYNFAAPTAFNGIWISLSTTGSSFDPYIQTIELC